MLGAARGKRRSRGMRGGFGSGCALRTGAALPWPRPPIAPGAPRHCPGPRALPTVPRKGKIDGKMYSKGIPGWAIELPLLFFFSPPKRQRLAIKLPELILDEHRCVWVKTELEISRNTFLCNWALCIQMICVVLLRLVSSQAISNAKICFSFLWLKAVCNRAPWGKQITHPIHSSTPPQHTYALTPRELKKRKDRRKSGETTHPLSIQSLPWSLRLGLYIGLVPTVWEPSIFLREERVHGDQNISRGWLCKSNTSAWCVSCTFWQRS